jgi:hypothetical protein
MEFTFVKATGEVAFFRSDAEQADWTQEELTVNCTFPYVEGKVIERGMVILFQDPATSEWQAFEIRQCSLLPGDAYQQFTAESIAISELTDCHIQSQIEFDNVSVSSALSQILANTGWNVGTVGDNPVSSGDVSRGAVWMAVGELSQNWNVYIVPRVTVNSSGISGRYLDIVPSSGVDRGLRLAINKNVTDPCVTYDDTDLYTALYGYGGTYTEGSGSSKATLEYNFSSVVWNKTSDHPAKPAGQRYIEYPEKTAMFGRNGRPRFGYYQNTNIKDPSILLQKTWESLKQCCDPKISITGTVADLKRLGYADVPLRIHDMAIVELEPAGLLFYKQVIQLTVDLLDPTKNLPTIGDYIPNIIYINRDTESTATGGGKGRGGKGNTKVDLEFSEYKTNTIDNGHQIELNAQHIKENGDILQQAGMSIDPETGVLIYAEDNENMVGSKFHVQSDRITAEVTNRQNEDNLLSSRITQTADAISLEVSERKGADNALSGRITVEKNRITQEVTDRTNADSTLSGRITVEANKITQIVSAVGSDGQVTAASICLAINNGGSSATINADKIYLLGQTIANTITADYIKAKIATIPTLTTNSLVASNIQFGVGGGVYGNPANAIMNLQLHQDGNNYQIWGAKFNGDIVKTESFSRATSLSGAWSGNKYTVTASPQGNTISVLPSVHVKGSQGGNYVDVCVGVHDGTSWTDHGSNQRLTLSVTSLRVDLIDSNGGVLATTTATNPYPSSMTLSQKTNASGNRQFTAYYLNGSTYVSMGSHYWYSSGTNLNTSSKTVHY